MGGLKCLLIEQERAADTDKERLLERESNHPYTHHFGRFWIQSQNEYSEIGCLNFFKEDYFFSHYAHDKQFQWNMHMPGPDNVQL